MEASVAQPAVSTRRRGSLSEASSAFLSQVQEIIEGMKPYWPLTLRQVYYQCVSAMILENNLKSYQKLSRLLVKARLDGRVSWEAMEDRSRTFNDRPQTVDFDEYVYSETDGILSPWGYRINPMDDQPVPLEMWVEKDALAGIIEPIAAQFSVPLVVARGNASVSFLSEFRYRVLRNRLHHEFEDRPTRVLYLGDLDPSGWFMFPHSLITLRDEMDLGDLVQHTARAEPRASGGAQPPAGPNRLQGSRRQRETIPGDPRRARCRARCASPEGAHRACYGGHRGEPRLGQTRRHAATPRAR